MTLVEKESPRVFGNRALQSLNGNKDAWGTISTPPDRKHYPHTFLWDGAFVAIVRARYGDVSQASYEIREIIRGQKEDGLIPNMKFGPGRKLDPERRTFKNPNESSDYSQPPLLAHAVLETAQKMNAKDGQEFVHEVYPSLQRYYDYLLKTRQEGRDSLIAVIHPHETGRDSDPTFDFAKKRIPTPPNGIAVIRGVVDGINTVLDYAGALNLNARHKKNGWDVEKAKDVFWVKDVMFNAIYSQNLQYMADLSSSMGYKEDAREYTARSQQVEQDIIANMWNKTSQAFHAIDKNGEHISQISVSNLFPILLPNVPKYQLESIVQMLESRNWFKARYPIPSVPLNSKKFDGSYTERRLWRGPTWMNMNWYIVEGLLMQRGRFKNCDLSFAKRLNANALEIAYASKLLVDREGYREFYDPETGRGKRVKNFAWSTLGDLVTDRIPDMTAFVEEVHILNHKNGVYDLPRNI